MQHRCVGPKQLRTIDKCELRCRIMRLPLHDISFWGSNEFGLFLSLENEFGNAGGAAKLIRLSANNPSAFGVGFGARDRAKPVAGPRPQIVLRPEVSEFFRGEPAVVGCNIRQRICSRGGEI